MIGPGRVLGIAWISTVACGGQAVIDELPKTPCERACARIGPCLADPASCIPRCEAIPERCADDKAAFLDCATAAARPDCTFDSACAEPVTRLLACADASGIEAGSCDGSIGECYCSWRDAENSESYYSCVGQGCSCYVGGGLLGACSFEADTCDTPAAGCCAQLQALAGRD